MSLCRLANDHRMSKGVKIFAGRATQQLGEKVAKEFGIPLGNVTVAEFSDGEFQPSFEETVRGQDVFIVQSTPPPSENLMELLLMVDAAKRASAKNYCSDSLLRFCSSRQKRQ